MLATGQTSQEVQRWLSSYGITVRHGQRLALEISWMEEKGLGDGVVQYPALSLRLDRENT